MVPLLCLVQPYDVGQDARVDIRAADGLSAEVFGLGGFRWLPAIETRPSISVECMSLDLDGRVQTARMSIGLAGDFAKNKAYKWTGAPITVWSAPNLEYATRAIEFTGEVTNTRVDLERGVLRLTCQVSTSALDTDMLTEEFTGAGGATGEAEMRGTLKPAGFGFVQNIEPVWFDKTNWVGMIDGYGNTLSVQRLMEGASEWAPAVADYADYASLVAAIVAQDIPPGRWGTCIAEGLIGLGAPPAYPIGVDATFGSNRLGAIAKRVMLTHGGVDAGLVDDASWDALDVSVPYDAHLWVKGQRNVRQVVEALAASGNATPIVTPQGKIVASRAVKTAAVATLDRSGSRVPRVTNWESAGAVPPYWQLKARTARPANVLSFDQVLYADELIDRGTYSPTETYRQGHIVWLDDGSSWLYINDTPTAGNYPEDPSVYWAPLTGAKGGIVTTRYPEGAPTDVPIGSIYWDANNQPFRLEYGDLTFNADPLLYDTDPLNFVGYISVQDQALRQAVIALQAADDDGILTIDEKIRVVVPESARLEAAYQSVLAQAAATGQDTTTLTAARDAWLSLRDSLVPAWNDITQITTITRTDWDSVLNAYRLGLEGARTDGAVIGAVQIVPPAAQEIALDSDGNPDTGEFPRTLTPVVKRGALDIRTDDAVSYSLAPGALTATVNNTPGDPDKGKITVTAGTGGTMQLTVTVDGVDYGPYPIAFTGRYITGIVETANGVAIYLPRVGLPPIIVQYITGTNSTTEQQETINWPVAFPNACLFALPGTMINGGDNTVDMFFQLNGLPGLSSVNVFNQRTSGGSTGTGATPLVIGVGY